MNSIHTEIFHSPCGDLLVGSYEGRLCLCEWTEGKKGWEGAKKLARKLNARIEETPSETTREAVGQLKEYFAGTRTTFTLPLLFVGTAFQQEVWQALLDVPYATTKSYGWVAARIQRPKAVRAVGMANGANPISIFAPCHRIIGSDGSLTGYGGGLAAKQYLLQLETANHNPV